MTLATMKTNWLAYLFACLLALHTVFTFAPAVQQTFAAGTCPTDAYLDPSTGKWTTDANGTTELTSDQISACKQNGGALGGKVVRFITIVSGLGVALAFGVIVYGGVKYIMSNGNDKETEAAKMQIWYAFVGMLVIGLAFVILKFVISATGV